MKDQILLFHFKDEHRLNTVRKILMTLKIKYKLIEDEECDQPIGSFVGLEAIDIPPAPSAPLTEEVMVMCGLNDGGIQLVLTALRKSGIYIPYKAVLTTTNKDWTASQLFAELYEEHAAMKAMEQEKQRKQGT